MGWSGSGSFTRSHDWTDDAAASVPITASRMDTEDDNFATGINACLAKNGENAATGNLNIGGYRLTSVGAGSAATDAATIGGTETLTNKTLTSPTISGPTLSGTVAGNVTHSGTLTLSGNNTHSGNNTFSGTNTHSGIEKFQLFKVSQDTSSYLNIGRFSSGYGGGVINLVDTDGGSNHPTGLGIQFNGVEAFQLSNAGALSIGSLSLTTKLAVTQGGTSVGSFTAYGVLTGGTTSTGALQSISPGTEMHVLKSGGASALPSFQAPYYAALGYRTTNLSHTSSSSYIDVPMLSESFDSGTIHSTSANQELFTAPSWATKARFTAQISFDTNSTGHRGARIVDSAGNPLTPTVQQLYPAAGSGVTVAIVSPIIPVTGGTSYKLQAYQNSGGTVTINSTSNETWMGVEFFP